MSKEEIIAFYAARTYTIRELARKAELSYSVTRRIILDAGYSYGKRRP